MRRRLARELALQSMYQMQMTSVSSKEAVTMVVEEAITDNEANLSVKKRMQYHRNIFCSWWKARKAIERESTRCCPNT